LQKGKIFGDQSKMVYKTIYISKPEVCCGENSYEFIIFIIITLL